MANITINIESEHDLFDHYDTEGLRLNPAFVSYLRSQALMNRPDPQTTSLTIFTSAPLDETRVRRALENYMNESLEKCRIQRRNNRFMEFYLFLIGVACILGGIMLNKVNAVYLQILSLTAGFAIKEAATIFFMKNPKNTLERTRILLLSRAKVEIKQAGQRD